MDGLDNTLGENLLTPTRIYVTTILQLIKDFSIHGLAHITGGGITRNVPRVLPQGCRADIRKNTWPIPPIFSHIQKFGHVEEDEMYRVFNMGIGFVLVVSADQEQAVIDRANALGEQAMGIGQIVEDPQHSPSVTYSSKGKA